METILNVLLYLLFVAGCILIPYILYRLIGLFQAFFVIMIFLSVAEDGNIVEAIIGGVIGYFFSFVMMWLLSFLTRDIDSKSNNIKEKKSNNITIEQDKRTMKKSGNNISKFPPNKKINIKTPNTKKNIDMQADKIGEHLENHINKEFFSPKEISADTQTDSVLDINKPDKFPPKKTINKQKPINKDTDIRFNRLEKIAGTDDKNNTVKSAKKEHIPNANHSPKKRQAQNSKQKPKDKSLKENQTQSKVRKLTSEFWAEIAKRKKEIGDIGELIVLQYEREKVTREYGKSYRSKVIHVAKEIGDGLGYDIQSYKDERKIFIEVKTTTGKLYNNLFITDNELQVMYELDDRYYLYRVSELDENLGHYKLDIYKGREEIERAFDVVPHEYVLSLIEG